MSLSARDAGIQALKAGNAAAAIEHLQRAVQENPQDGQSHGYLGLAYGQAKQLEQAVASLGQAVRLVPTSSSLRYNLGAALEQTGKRVEAVDAYQKSLALDPKYERARQALTRLGAGTDGGGSAAAPAAAPAPPRAAGGLGDFALGPAPKVPGASSGTATVAADPSGTIPATAFSGPPPSFAPPAPGGPGQWDPAGPPGGMQPLGEWTGGPPPPPPSFGGSEMPPPGGGGIADGMAPPPRTTYTRTVPVQSIAAPARHMDRGTQLGHCFLMGMGTGVWWGLIGAAFVLIWSLIWLRVPIYMRFFPAVAVMMLMYVALGALLWGFIGYIGGSTEDAKGTCKGAGALVGLLQAGAWCWYNVGQMGAAASMVGGTTICTTLIGSVWISMLLGQALGAKVDEFRCEYLVVTGPQGVAVA